MSTNADTARFELGKTLMTRGAQGALEEAGQSPQEFLKRHECGDWGEVSEDDRQANELFIKEGFRILSAYSTSKGQRIWIITEADRSATTICSRTNAEVTGHLCDSKSEGGSTPQSRNRNQIDK